MIAVPAGKHHMMLNQRDNKEANYTIHVSAKLDLRDYLGTYFQESKEVKKPVPTATTPPPIFNAAPLTIPSAPLVPGSKRVP